MHLSNRYGGTSDVLCQFNPCPVQGACAQICTVESSVHIQEKSYVMNLCGFLLELGIALYLCTSLSLLGNLDNPDSNVFSLFGNCALSLSASRNPSHRLDISQSQCRNCALIVANLELRTQITSCPVNRTRNLSLTRFEL